MSRLFRVVVTAWILPALLGVQAIAAPGEVRNLRADESAMVWDFEPQANRYHLYRGHLVELGTMDGATCYAPNLARTDLVEPAIPQPGQTYYYLVTAVDDSGEGPAGDGSASAPARQVSNCGPADPSGLAVQVLSEQSYEKDGTPGWFRVSRGGGSGLDELTVHFTLTGDDDPTLGSASPSDYLLHDGLGASITDTLLLRAGEGSADVMVLPRSDGRIEVPETLQLILLGDPDYTLGATSTGSIKIHDARNLPENERLLLAYLTAEPGVPTLASGLSVVRVPGDNDIAAVDLSFNNLTSAQTAVHIHVANPVNGPPVESLPLGQVDRHAWEIRAAQFLTTDQQVLDALLSGLLYVNVHSSNHPSGEIRGSYHIYEGSTELVVPPDPPALPVLTGETLDRDIVRFLMQSTFGPTAESVDELRQLIAESDGDRIAGMSAWIDRQLDTQQTPTGDLLTFTLASSQAFLDNSKDRRSGWWLFARYGRDQLRQRVAFALSEILVVSDQNSKVANAHLGAADFYDVLIDGAFGSYRDLLLNVTLHPIMGNYLSHLRNQKALVDGEGQVITSRDENYAREVMQLLSFGLVKRHLDGTIVLDDGGSPIATYSNAVITEMAELFTGLSFGKRVVDGEVVENGRFNLGIGNGTEQTRWRYPMKMFEEYHETDVKELFDGHVIPSGQPGMTDIELVHDLLVAHPTTAPFISRLLIQRLVTSNPSRGYVYRVAQLFQQSNANLGQVVKAILLDYEARSLDVVEDVGFGKQKEPLIRFAALARFLNVASLVPLSALSDYGYPPEELVKFPEDATNIRINTEGSLEQVALSSPSVFNFFLPDYRPPGPLTQAGLVAPEFQLSTESQVYGTINYYRSLLLRARGIAGNGVPPDYPSDADDLHPDLTSLQSIYDTELAAGSVESASEALLDHLDLYLNAGGLKQRYADATEPNPRSLMLESIVNFSDAQRVANTVYIVASSPQVAIQR